MATRTGQSRGGAVTAGDPIVSVDAVSKTYGTGEDAVTAVDGVTFDVRPGTVVGVLGPNGAGKTTLIKSMLGLIIPDEGEVTVDVVTVVPIAVLALASAVGVGFVFAAMALLYKRVENVFQFVQWGFIGLIIAPVHAYPELKVLPLAQRSDMLQVAMRDGVRLWEFSPAELGILVAVAAGYFAAGYLVFQFAQRRARRKGLLGQY